MPRIARIAQIVIHTAAAADLDVDVATIRQWHLARGFRDIGYHYLVRLSGEVQLGRPVDQVGAHVNGHNRDTIGVCFAGHGDVEPWAPAQDAAGLHLLVELCRRYQLPSSAIVGHRELCDGRKTCPGKLIDLDQLRGRLAGMLVGPSDSPSTQKGPLP